MTVEQVRPRVEEAKPQTTSDIFKYYSVPNEIAFLDRVRQGDVGLQDSDIYVQENVERFLGEFAGQVPYTRISYLQKDGLLKYAGMDLTESYRSTSKNSDRELDECIGYEKIQAGFGNGAHTAVWISPPKIADYGFVFFFQRDPQNPEHVREFILRYNERKGDLATSQKILDRIDPLQSFSTDRDYLQRPHIFFEQDGNHPTLQTIMAGVGISSKQIESSKQFEERVRAELGGWTNQYSQAVSHGDVDLAKLVLRSIYNRACEIKKEIDGGAGTYAPPRALPIDGTLLHFYAKQERPVSQGSCPVSQTNFEDPFSPTSIMDQLVAGNTLNNVVTETQHFTCPNCNHKADGPVGDQCPSCSITRAQWAEKGNKVC